MTSTERAARRRRLVLGALGAGPADVATVARRVRGKFYDVLAVLEGLQADGLVEPVQDGRVERWRPAPVDNPVDNRPSPALSTIRAHLSTGISTGGREATSGIARDINMRTGTTTNT